MDRYIGTIDCVGSNSVRSFWEVRISVWRTTDELKVQEVRSSVLSDEFFLKRQIFFSLCSKVWCLGMFEGSMFGLGFEKFEVRDVRGSECSGSTQH